MERTGWGDKWKHLKKDQLLIGILAGILLLVIALPENQKETEELLKNPEVSGEEPEKQDTAAQLEAKFQEILEQSEGVGRARVMITVKSSGKKWVEKDSSQSENTDFSGEDTKTVSERAEESTVYQRDSQGNERPFIIEETAPEIEGVLVAAQGAANHLVAEDIIEAAQVLFGVEVHKIKVMKLN